MKYIKNCLIAGILVWLPIALTIWILGSLLKFVDNLVPVEINHLQFGGYSIPGIGLLIVLLILFVTGIITKNFVGQSLINLSDKIIMHIPIVKSIYKGIKQVSDTLLASNSKAFRKAVLVQFPHSTTLTIAFITGDSITVSKQIESSEYVNVYIPTTPNPTSGYFIMVRQSDIIETELTVDEALRYVISMGTINPTKKQTKVIK